MLEIFQKRISNRNVFLYCINIVKKYDYENYLASLLIKDKDARQAAFAVRALNAEIVQIQTTTTQDIIAKMRFQFWKDVVDEIYLEKGPKEPIALALQTVIQKNRPPKRWLMNLINSRENSLHDKPFRSVAELEKYSEESISSIYYFILHCAGIHNIKCDHYASHLGKCEGMNKLIRGIPHFANKNKVLIPLDIMIKHKAVEEDFIRRSSEEIMKEVIYDIASLSFIHSNMTLYMKAHIPYESYSIMFPSIAQRRFLIKLQRAHFNIFNESLHKRDNFLPFKLLLTSFL